jgi:hypothetical protein
MAHQGTTRRLPTRGLGREIATIAASAQEVGMGFLDKVKEIDDARLKKQVAEIAELEKQMDANDVSSEGGAREAS